MGVFQYIMQKPEQLWMLVLFIAFFVMMWKNKLPSIEGFSKFIALMDTRGGNIAILSIFSFWSIMLAVRFGYYSMHAVIQAAVYKVPLPADTPAQLLFSYLTTSVGSNFTGALIKTMTGAGGSDHGNSNGQGATPVTRQPQEPAGATPKTDG